MWKAKADAAATSGGFIAICLATLSASASGSFLIYGTFRDDSYTWTAGSILYISEATAGVITATKPSTSGNQIRIIGYALDADNIIFIPDATYTEV